MKKFHTVTIVISTKKNIPIRFGYGLYFNKQIIFFYVFLHIFIFIATFFFLFLFEVIKSMTECENENFLILHFFLP